eukprot:s2381_g3.t1
MEDLRCTVERILQAQLEDINCFLDREYWVRFLQIIGGTEEEAQALLREIPEAQISIKEFLDLLFEAKRASEVLRASGSTRTKNLKEYFEKHYREGGEFCHWEYLDCAEWTWKHRPTGIQVWRDAIDLTSGEGGQEAAEIWASLRTEGPNANAWWGKGIYTVPFPPDQWQSREQLLDNHFRNMMQRDRDSDDPQKGPAYVDREYPKRAAFCVPILIDPVNTFDVSIRATPEMEAAGMEPGRNLGNKLLNEPGKPPRCCVVLRVSGEDGVQHARGQLLDTLRKRVCLAPADLDAKRRLAEALRLRGFYQEALPVAQEMVANCKSRHAPDSEQALTCQSILASILFDLGKLCESEELDRRILDARVKALGPEHKETLSSVAELASTLFKMNNPSSDAKAVGLYRQVIALQEKQLGPSHHDTIHTITNLAIALAGMGNFGEAIELHSRALEARERILGPEHPETLQSVSHLAIALHDRGDLSEALALQRRALEARERHLGPQHPSTRRSLQRVRDLLIDMIKKEVQVPDEIVELCRNLLAMRAQTLGPQHPDTVEAKAVLGHASRCLEPESTRRDFHARAAFQRLRYQMAPDRVGVAVAVLSMFFAPHRIGKQAVVGGYYLSLYRNPN